MNEEHSNVLCKGVIGVGTNVLAVITSAQEQLEYWLRIGSLILGFTVGILTLISLIRGLRKK